MKRKGKTEVTSISLSKEFAQICAKYRISPTEAVRKGIAIELHERGIIPYANARNKARSDFLRALFAPILKIMESSDD